MHLSLAEWRVALKRVPKRSRLRVREGLVVRNDRRDQTGGQVVRTQLEDRAAMARSRSLTGATRRAPHPPDERTTDRPVASSAGFRSSTLASLSSTAFGGRIRCATMRAQSP